MSTQITSRLGTMHGWRSQNWHGEGPVYCLSAMPPYGPDVTVYGRDADAVDSAFRRACARE